VAETDGTSVIGKMYTDSWWVEARMVGCFTRPRDRKNILFINTVCWWIFVSCILVARTTSNWSIKFLKIFVISIIIIMTHSIQPKPPTIAFARTVYPPSAAGPRSLWHPCHGRSDESRWWVADHRHVSIPAMPLTISCLGTDSKDLTGWYGVWESGNVAE